MNPMTKQAVWVPALIILLAKPKLRALGKFVGKIGEDFGEHFTMTTLRAHDAGNDDEFTGYGQEG